MTLRYKLRTLLILLAVLPPLLGVAWVKYTAWKAKQAELQRRQGWVIEVRGYVQQAGLPYTLEDVQGTVPPSEPPKP